MRHAHTLVCLMSLGSLASLSAAELAPGRGPVHVGYNLRTLMRCWLPNDYCRKPIPCVRRQGPLGQVVEDCSKPLPLPPCPAMRGCANDYQPKSYPILIGPPPGCRAEAADKPHPPS
jgi:hypothetical protein